MSFAEKIANATETTWLTDGLSDSEIKSTIELAKISACIEMRRNEMGMTQSEFARYMSVTQGMISKWESGEYNFTINTLNDIFQKLDYTFTIDIEKKSNPNDYVILKWNCEKANTHIINSANYGKLKTLEGAIA